MDLSRPNIVLIYSDQHRGDALGCVGNPVVRTPNLDRLAAEGVTFPSCNTNSPLCMPARASLITGSYVNEHGAWGNRSEADRHGPSHVRNIKDAGYCTAVIGKTHFRLYQADDGHTRDHASGLHDWGYEFALEIKDTIPSSTHLCYYTDFLAERGKLQVYEDCARNFRLGQSTGLLRPWEHLPNLLEEDEHIDMYIANAASEWIQGYADDRPFYLQVCLTGPHPPFDAPAQNRDMFDPQDMPLAIMKPPAEPISPQVKKVFARHGFNNMTESQARTLTSHYYAKVAFDDRAIGIVFQSLRGKGLLDNTWIVYTSDHGEMLGDHGLSQKSVFYEGALNVPLIVRPPGGTKSWTSRGLTDHFDICTTLLDAAGAANLAVDRARSLLPKIEDGPDAPDAQQGKDVVFSEVNLYSMARTEQYKMTIDSLTREPLELYNMENDPHELRNLVNEPHLSSVRDQFLTEYFDHLLANLNESQLRVYQRGGIPTKLHQEYPQY
ncbi:MAG: sulfatase-like hydrolase/transferase [Gammaproteobacteria bacterium]|nr:sulfatase-like hydrolase/transferase [Gammaproteobacteria bacterium]